MPTFKTHMIRYSDDESFRTMCGIDDGASEAFYNDPNNLVDFGNTEKTTCSICLSRYQNELNAERERIDQIEKQAKLMGALQAFSLSSNNLPF